MPLQFIKSRFNGDQLLHDGYFYTKSRKANDKTYWKCVKYRSIKCPGTVHTENDAVVYIGQKNHNHVACSAEYKTREVLANIRSKARDTQDTPQEIIESCSRGLPASVQACLPKFADLKRKVQRDRNNAAAPEQLPSNLMELQIPDHLSLYNDHQFLLYDSGAGEDRILMFGTQKGLDLVSSCEHWYAAGTFKMAPPLFQQLFTILAVKYHSVVPAIFFLLPDKQQATYVRSLTAMKELKPSLTPVTVMTDFENEQINAFSHCFPNVENRGCFFHFGQRLWSKISSCSEIRAKYMDTEDPDFALKVRQLGALAFVPVEDIVKNFELLLNTPFFVNNEELLTPLVDYFEITWIGKLRPNGNGRRDPLCAHNLWNCYQDILWDLPMTNIAVEGWHRGFNSLMSANHLTIWKFIEVLKREQSLNDLKIEQYLEDLQPQIDRKKCRNTNENIKIIVQTYGNVNFGLSIDDYLQSIAHQFELKI